MDALSVAMRNLEPNGPVVHYEQGSQSVSDDGRGLCRSSGLPPGMSCRGNCRDSAINEHCVPSLTRKRIYTTRHQALEDIADCIDGLYIYDPITLEDISGAA